MNNQEAIEEFKKANEILRGGDNGSIRIAKTIVRNDLAIAALEAQKADTWIPVSERLPSKAEEVIACSKEGIIVMGYIKQGINRVICSNLPFVTYDIVAWRPLPEPWKEEQS